jgi:hypothetical protein
MTQSSVYTQEPNIVENIMHGSKNQMPYCKMAQFVLKEIGVIGDMVVG